MPEIDLTVTVSVIIALCAIVSPILTAIINNRHQLKIRKLEMQERLYENTVMYQRKIFENYLKYLGKCASHADVNALHEYGEYYLIALMYAPDNIQKKMKIANQNMQEYKWKNALSICEELTPLIHKHLQEL